MAYDPKQSIGYLVNRAAKEVRRKLSSAMVESNCELSMDQWRMLMVLHQTEMKNQQEIADMMGLDKTGITRLLNTMEEKGLIVRIEDQRDKRNKLIYATSFGREKRESIMPVVVKSIGEVEELLDPNELMICKKVLADIITKLCDEPGDENCLDK